MKKIFVVICMILSVAMLSGCGKEKNVEGKLTDLMEKLYSDIPSTERPMALGNIEVNEENIESFIGTKNVDYEEIIASESMIGSIAHSVVLIRTKSNANVEEIKKEIKEKIDPRKWICVGIERDEVVVKSRGNLILVLVVQNETNRNKLEKAFDNL